MINYAAVEKRKFIKEAQKEKALHALFGLYIYLNIASKYSVYADLSILLLAVTALAICLERNKVALSWYFVFDIAFIFYGIYQIQNNIAVYGYVAQAKVTTLIFSTMINFVVFNYIILMGNFRKILQTYVYAVGLAILTLFIIGGKTLMMGRFLHEEMNVFFLGKRIVASSSEIGLITATALIITIFLFLKESKLKCYGFGALFTICVILTGSRKAILVAVVGLVWLLQYLYTDKKARNLLIVAMVIFAGYCLVMYVPVFYNLMGSRLDNLFNYINTGKTNEPSISTRVSLINNGIKAFHKRPLNGYGLANYSLVVNDGGYYSHNNFVEILVSSGIVGFVIYYTKYVVILGKLFFTKVKEEEAQVQRRLLLILFSLITVCEYWYVTYQERNILIVHILILGFYYIDKEQSQNNSRKKMKSMQKAFM